MVTLFVTSSEKGSGKTTVSAGLGKHLLNNGRKVGFFKPLIADKNQPSEGADSDAAFMKQLLAMDESVDIICPVFSNENKLRSGMKEALARVSQDKDVVIVEGISDYNQAYRNIAEILGARVIGVESYSIELSKIVNSYKDYGERLLGIVVNKVPKSRVEQARSEIATHSEQTGVAILGVLPEDRTLYALSTEELVEHIQGKILIGAEKSSELVENVMLGAMVVDPGPDYFGRKANKAVVLRSERPDMQLAALETSTSCLVLTGNTAPKQVVLHYAEERNIPVVFTSDDIITIVTNIENVIGKTRFNQGKKLPKLTEIMGQYFNFQTAYRGLGLAS